MNITTRPTAARRRAHTLVLAAAAAAAVCVAAPAQSAAASPKPQGPSRVDTQLAYPTGCGDQLRDLTVQFRDLGFTGQASHIAAQLTLGC